MARPQHGPNPIRVGIWIVVACLVAAVIVFLAAGRVFADPLTGNGYTALILGVVFTVVVGVALMGLVFASSRSGADNVARLDDRLDDRLDAKLDGRPGDPLRDRLGDDNGPDAGPRR